MYCNYVTGAGRRLGFWDGERMLRLPGRSTDEFILDGSGFPELPADAMPETDAFRFAPALLAPRKILCLMRSYGAHAREGGHAPPPAPLYFAKLSNCLVGHGEPVAIPSDLEGEVHHEGELALVIGRRGRRIPAAEGLLHVAAYSVANDITARTRQRADAAQGWPWLRAKSADTFLPLGPGLVPAGAVPRPDDLPVRVRVNGGVRQDGNTGNLLWPIGDIVAAVSQWITLEPGDVILTGTPEGVGPLVPGDRVTVEIPGVGVLENPVTRE